MLETVLSNLQFSDGSPPVQGLEEGGPVWVEVLAARNYETKQYGTVAVTPEKLHRMAANFGKGVRGQDVAVDFDHGADRAKGNKAAGWYKQMAVRPSSADPNGLSLYALIDFTDEARREISDQQWKYFSLEWDDDWTDNDGSSFQDVIIGG